MTVTGASRAADEVRQLITGGLEALRQADTVLSEVRQAIETGNPDPEYLGTAAARAGVLIANARGDRQWAIIADAAGATAACRVPGGSAHLGAFRPDYETDHYRPKSQIEQIHRGFKRIQEFDVSRRIELYERLVKQLDEGTDPDRVASMFQTVFAS